MAGQSHQKSQAARRPAQQQKKQPGRQTLMRPQPRSDTPLHVGSGKLKGKVALITGGDSGIGRAVAVAYAREGATVAITYLNEDADANETKRLIEQEEQGVCLLLKGDIRKEAFSEKAVQRTVAKFGKLDVLVNNAAEQHVQDSILRINQRQLESTFQTNIFSMFYGVKAALPHLEKQDGAAIINTTSVTAYRGSPTLLDYSASKGAIVAFTRSLALNLVEKGIRVNAVAPGPIWTPLIPATFDKKRVAKFGSGVPMKRAGEPWECAGCFVFLASFESSYMTGQVLHPNGGEIING